MNNNNFKYISIDVISSRILKHPLLKDMNPEDIISHTVDVLRLVNVPVTYIDKSCYVEIIEYKSAMPENNVNIKSVDLVSAGYLVPMVGATDTLNNHLDAMENPTTSSSYTYTVDNGIIKTNCESGTLFVTYNMLACADDGLPMIPDSIPLIKAIENYIKSNVFGVMADLGKMPRQAADKAEQEYNWYIGKAQSSFQGFRNEDDMESFLRDFKRLFITNNSHSSRHKHNVEREVRTKF